MTPKLILQLTCHRRVTGPVVLAGFRAACAQYGVPASARSDNATVYTARFAGPGGRGGNAFEHELRRPHPDPRPANSNTPNPDHGFGVSSMS